MANILFVIAPKDFRDEEYFIPKDILENAGHKIITASNVIGEIDGSHGRVTQSTININEINQKDYDAVVFVGGKGSYQYDTNTQIHRIAQEFFNQGKLTTAICHAPILLAKSGVLINKKATVHKSDVEELENLGVLYTPQDVVIDENIITANGPSSAEKFGNTLATKLN